MASYPSYTLGQWKTMTGDAPSRVDLSNILNASYTSSHTPDLYPPAASNPPQHRPATSKDTSCSNLPSPATSLEDIYKKPASSTRRRHRRRQLENEAHVNRPPNCFILFRIHWVQHQKNADKKRLSARAGEAWKELSDKERARWRALAKDVAADHLQHHPDYVYKPRKRGSSASKQDIHKEGQPRAKFLDSDVWSGTSSLVNTAHSPSAAPSDLVFEAGPVSTTTLVGTSASTVPIARASSLPALVNPLPREAPRAVQRSHSMRSPHMHNCVVPQAYSPWSLSPDFSLHQEVVETASYPTVHNNNFQFTAAFPHLVDASSPIVDAAAFSFAEEPTTTHSNISSLAFLSLENAVPSLPMALTPVDAYSDFAFTELTGWDVKTRGPLPSTLPIYPSMLGVYKSQPMQPPSYVPNIMPTAEGGPLVYQWGQSPRLGVDSVTYPVHHQGLTQTSAYAMTSQFEFPFSYQPHATSQL